jgi:hypothetical protein
MEPEEAPEDPDQDPFVLHPAMYKVKLGLGSYYCLGSCYAWVLTMGFLHRMCVFMWVLTLVSESWLAGWLTVDWSSLLG